LPESGLCTILPSRMRKLLIVAAALLLVHVALLFAGRGGQVSAEKSGVAKVGIVLDVGGRGDKSFNDGAYAGADSASKVLGANVRFIEPGEGSDREAGLRLLAAEKMDVVIGVGFIFSDDITNLAKEYPTVPFACVDYALAVDKNGNVTPPPPNVAALKFREEEGSFLVGFFTKKLDGLLVGIFFLLIAGFWFFADAFLGELLLFTIAFIPAKSEYAK